MKKVFTLLLACIILAAPLYAQESIVSRDKDIPCGTIEPKGPVLTNEQIVAITLQDPMLSAKQKQQIQQKVALVENSYFSKMADSDTTLYVNPIMQETNVWCAAATIQQTLGYMGVSYNSQSSIMQSTGAAPALATVLSCLNSKQSDNNYIRSVVNSQTDLDNRLAYAYRFDSPVVFTMKATTGNVSNGIWPYSTNGHFTNLCGKSPYGTAPYRVADPFYFKHYVSSAGSGLLFRSFDQFWTVNGNLFGSNNHTIGY